MTLSDSGIKEAIRKGDLIIENFDEQCLEPASYDSRLGRDAFLSNKEVKGGRIDLEKEQDITIEPGQFAILSTHEKIKLTNKVVGRIGLRGHFARKGLVLLSGPQIDPTYYGILTVSIFNAGPGAIPLEYKEHFCTLEFSYLDTPSSKEYSGDFQGQTKIPKEDIEFLTGASGATLSALRRQVMALDSSVTKLDSTVDKLNNTIGSLGTKFDSFGRVIYYVVLPLLGLSLIALISVLLMLLGRIGRS